jgi:hypothetical protein
MFIGHTEQYMTRQNCLRINLARTASLALVLIATLTYAQPQDEFIDQGTGTWTHVLQLA